MIKVKSTKQLIGEESLNPRIQYIVYRIPTYQSIVWPTRWRSTQPACKCFHTFEIDGLERPWRCLIPIKWVWYHAVMNVPGGSGTQLRKYVL